MTTESSTGRNTRDTDFAYRLPGIPVPVAYRSDWKRRLDEWHALRKVPIYEELATVRAGRAGELGLLDRLGRYEASRFGEIFGGKRVYKDPRNPRAGRYEIDLILVTPKSIHAIEVKNWSGRVSIDNGQWVHQRRNGEVQVFEDLVDYQRSKLGALQKFMQTKDIVLPPQRYEYGVVFTHPRVALDATVAAHPGVMNVGKLLQRQARQGSAPKTSHVLARIIETFASNESASKLIDGLFDIMPPHLVGAVGDAVSDLRTWDQLHLRGGRRLIGDLLWMQVGGERIQPVGWPLGTAIRLAWRRGALGGLWALFCGRPLGVLRGKPLASRAIAVHDCLYFHEAGQRHPNVIALRDIDMIKIG